MSVSVHPRVEWLAAYAWRLLVIGLAVYALLRFLGMVLVVAIPIFAAILVTRFLYPVHRGLTRRGVPVGLSAALNAVGLVVVVLALLLAVGASLATQFDDGFGIGVGTIILAINVILLGSYTFGCHSLRHLVGGRRDTISDRPVQHKLWQWVSVLNRRHMLFAWLSLFWVGFTDFYIRMCHMGVFTDYRIL